ncbi:MAG: hypothetical protein DWP98_09275 [Bacteroidetes bacterium]|nr:MAG: hypothetical protein DWP98_09275 [Bacteroidota bacterium]MBL1144066.1 hypothetical protein [Bacteroidota bacterium]
MFNPAADKFNCAPQDVQFKAPQWFTTSTEGCSLVNAPQWFPPSGGQVQPCGNMSALKFLKIP